VPSIWRFVLGDGKEGIIILDLILADRDEYRRAIDNAVEFLPDGCLIKVIEPQDLIAVKQLVLLPTFGYPPVTDRDYILNKQFICLTLFSQIDLLGLAWRTRATKVQRRAFTEIQH